MLALTSEASGADEGCELYKKMIFVSERCMPQQLTWLDVSRQVDVTACPLWSRHPFDSRVAVAVAAQGWKIVPDLKAIVLSGTDREAATAIVILGEMALWYVEVKLDTEVLPIIDRRILQFEERGGYRFMAESARNKITGLVHGGFSPYDDEICRPHLEKPPKYLHKQ